MSDDPADLEMPPDPSPGLMLLDQVILRGHTESGVPFERVMTPAVVNFVSLLAMNDDESL